MCFDLKSSRSSRVGLWPGGSLIFHNAAFCFGFVATVAGLGAADAQTPLAGARPALNNDMGVPDDARPQNPVRDETRGNPLWAISVTSLSATRERPIFQPSRRPPTPAVAGPLSVVPDRPPPPPTQPDRPQLALVGAVVGNTESIAVFMDGSTRGFVRLKTGDGHAGWILRSVKGREAILQKGIETVILALPAPSDQQTRAPQSVLPGLSRPAGAAEVLPGLTPPFPFTTSGGPPPELPAAVPPATPNGRLPGL
jgi:hypothetical protein